MQDIAWECTSCYFQSLIKTVWNSSFLIPRCTQANGGEQHAFLHGSRGKKKRNRQAFFLPYYYLSNLDVLNLGNKSNIQYICKRRKNVKSEQVICFSFSDYYLFPDSLPHIVNEGKKQWRNDIMSLNHHIHLCLVF